MLLLVRCWSCLFFIYMSKSWSSRTIYKQTAVRCFLVAFVFHILLWLFSPLYGAFRTCMCLRKLTFFFVVFSILCVSCDLEQYIIRTRACKEQNQIPSVSNIIQKLLGWVFFLLLLCSSKWVWSNEVEKRKKNRQQQIDKKICTTAARPTKWATYIAINTLRQANWKETTHKTVCSFVYESTRSHLTTTTTTKLLPIYSFFFIGCTGNHCPCWITHTHTLHLWSLEIELSQ